MNVIQYFSKPALVGYLQSHNITKVIADPELENKLDDLGIEVTYYSSEEASKKHNDELSKKKSVTRGESPITAAQALKTKLEEESITDYTSAVKITNKSVKFAGVDSETPNIHKIVYSGD